MLWIGRREILQKIDFMLTRRQILQLIAEMDAGEAGEIVIV
jgi:hypothetical protein